MKVEVEISNRHVHLTKEIYDLLFDEEINKIKDLSQTGEFVTDKVVTIINNENEINNVKLLGPLRSYNQVEVSRKDAIKLGINPSVRRSGDLKDAEKITIRTPKGEVTLNSCIIAQRHIHVNTNEAKKLGLEDKMLVSVKVPGDKSGVMDAYVKVSDNGVFKMHIDTDDAAAFLINQNDILDLQVNSVK